ncbi:hypothetical protein AURDEDRAFT_188738 [Auricularia subglabra TFB-10046 SS5]|uniref:C2 domain-containing protein n=1 Tax=Auricularia subglabra (strain TFB-10046 / SS5) TaxID=717982 RepID=J0WT80_AURST|nr:hypothetical protein AURDEDRAFT_188738 [Auricularia subglabra TFB-10046 SS5]
MSTPSRPSTPTRSGTAEPAMDGSQRSSPSAGQSRSRLLSLSRSIRNSVHISPPKALSRKPTLLHDRPSSPTPTTSTMLSSPTGTPTKKLRRSLKARFTGHGRGTGRAQIEPLPDEKPAATLRIQVIGCRNLPAADANGKSDPYVVVTFARQRHKTPVIQKTLSPTYDPKNATFDFPVYASVVEKIGSLVEFVVWDKDLIGKDYLGEVPLTASDWFKHNGGLDAMKFDDPNNADFWLPLSSSRSKKDAKGDIHLKLGFLEAPNNDPAHAYADLMRRARGGHVALLSAPATQGIGTLGGGGDVAKVDAGAESDDDDATSAGDRSSFRSSLGPDDSLFARSRTVSSVSTAPTLPSQVQKKLPSFRLNWAGTKIDYSFSGHRDVAGIVLIEVKGAKDLPKTKNWARSGWDMDPFVVVTYGKKTFRTRVIRHSLDPTWNEKIMFHVRKADLESNNKIQISVLDWDKFASDDLVGDASVHVGELMARVPPANPETGLYREDMNLANGMTDMTLPLTVSKDASDGKSSPVVIISAKYEPHASFRQRFWRQNLHQFDADRTGKFSFNEINAFLDDMGLSLDPDTVYSFFPAHGKKALGDELTLDETIQSLEEAIGMALEKGQRPPWAEDAAREVDKQAEKDKETESLAESIESALKEHEESPPAEPVQSPLTPTTPATAAAVETPPASAGATTPPPTLADANASTEPPARPGAETQHPLDASQEASAQPPPPPKPEPVPEPQPRTMADTARSNGGTQRPDNKPRQSTFGRNRESIADIEGQLIEIFTDHPDADLSTPDKPSVPGHALFDILNEFSDAHGGLALFEPDEEQALKGILDSNPELRVSPDLILGFLAQVTPAGAHPSPPAVEDHSEEEEFIQDDEGDITTRAPPGGFGAHSRSSSRSTTRGSRQASPERSFEPKTPKSDAFHSRQRSTPIQPAPTSWKPQSNYRRRRSSAGSQGRPHISDNESSSNERGPIRSRVPSNPTSPPGNVSFPGGRRSQSRPVSPQRQNSNGNGQQPRARYGSQGMGDSGVLVLRPGEVDPHDLAALSPSDLHHSDDSDPDDDMEANLVRARDSVASVASLMPFERLEALQRANTDLMRKLQDSERALASKIMEHETELEELQSKLDDVQEELHNARREEKELRVKERNTTMELQQLEGEVTKLQKALENSRASYQSLQKQYQEQIAESSKYRSSLLRKDQDLKEAEENAAAHFEEMNKWKNSHEVAENTITNLQNELQILRQAQQSLHEQKQENLMLKETIDRLRFDLDELRTAKSAAAAGASGPASLAGTLSRSLANELKAQLAAEPLDESPNRSREEEEIVEETERGSDDDYVETIIKRRKKVARRAPGAPAPANEDIVKEYNDDGVQHGPELYTSSHSAQTEPLPAPPPPPEPAPRASASTQTDRPPTPPPVAPAPRPEPMEGPPPYHVLHEEEREAIGREVIDKWHPGYRSAGVQGVTQDAVREWANLKRELGFECAAIDKVVGEAPVVGPREGVPVPKDDAAAEEETVRSLAGKIVHRVVDTCHRRLGVLSPQMWLNLLTFLCAFGGVYLLVLIFFPPLYPNYSVPSYYDRIWWSSYNTLGTPGIEGMYRRTGGFWANMQGLYRGLVPLGRIPRPLPVPT